MNDTSNIVQIQKGFFKLVQLDQHIINGEKTAMYWVTTIARHIVDEAELEQLKADCYYAKAPFGWLF